MTRVPIPDDYDREHIDVSGSEDYHYGESDVNLDDVDHARNLTVQEDDDGRYVGAPEQYADDVAEFLDVTPDDSNGDAETCDAVKSDGEVCGRELPCPYHDDEDRGDE